MGSEFSYEDLDIAAPIEAEWKSVERIEENGRSLVRVTGAPYASYERVETVIDPATSLPVRVSYYDRSGELFKRATFGEIQKIDGHPMPTLMALVSGLGYVFGEVIAQMFAQVQRYELAVVAVLALAGVCTWFVLRIRERRRAAVAPEE